MQVLDAHPFPPQDWPEPSQSLRKRIPMKWSRCGTGPPTSCWDLPNIPRPSTCGEPRLQTELPGVSKAVGWGISIPLPVQRRTCPRCWLHQRVVGSPRGHAGFCVPWGSGTSEHAVHIRGEWVPVAEKGHSSRSSFPSPGTSALAKGWWGIRRASPSLIPEPPLLL